MRRPDAGIRMTANCALAPAGSAALIGTGTLVHSAVGRYVSVMNRSQPAHTGWADVA